MYTITMISVGLSLCFIPADIKLSGYGIEVYTGDAFLDYSTSLDAS